MRIHHATARLSGALVLALTLLAGPLVGHASAQDAPPDDSTAQQDSSVGEEEMLHFVQVQMAIDSLQEEAVQEMAAIHSEDGRAQIRNNLTEAIASVQEEHGMTAERYKAITFLVSSDEAVRELFEATLTEMREGGGGEG